MALAGVVLAVMLGSAIFSTFSLIVACVVKSRERFMGIGQVLTMPLFFASNAIYPLILMPVVAARRFAGESAHLSGGRSAGFDGRWRRKRIRPVAGFPDDDRRPSRYWLRLRHGFIRRL